MIIIRDSREKVDFWRFDQYEECKGEIVKGLKSADYSIEGYEDEISLERKRTTGELATNLGSKLTQFRAELERLQSYNIRYVLLEFTLEDLLAFPENSGIPKKTWGKLKMSGKYMAKLINELSEQFKVEFVFCGNKDNAENIAFEILKEFYNAKTKHS